MAYPGRNVLPSASSRQSDWPVAHSGQCLRCCSHVHLTRIFPQCHVPHRMPTVFERPVSPPQPCKLLRRRVLRPQADHTICHRSSHLARFQLNPFGLPPQNLLHLWPEEMLIQVIRAGHRARFQPAMPVAYRRHRAPGAGGHSIMPALLIQHTDVQQEGQDLGGEITEQSELWPECYTGYGVPPASFSRASRMYASTGWLRHEQNVPGRSWRLRRHSCSVRQDGHVNVAMSGLGIASVGGWNEDQDRVLHGLRLPATCRQFGGEAPTRLQEHDRRAHAAAVKRWSLRGYTRRSTHLLEGCAGSTCRAGGDRCCD